MGQTTRRHLPSITLPHSGGTIHRSCRGPRRRRKCTHELSTWVRSVGTARPGLGQRLRVRAGRSAIKSLFRTMSIIHTKQVRTAACREPRDAHQTVASKQGHFFLLLLFFQIYHLHVTALFANVNFALSLFFQIFSSEGNGCGWYKKKTTMRIHFKCKL